jgi:hypothetical protein
MWNVGDLEIRIGQSGLVCACGGSRDDEADLDQRDC